MPSPNDMHNIFEEIRNLARIDNQSENPLQGINIVETSNLPFHEEPPSSYKTVIPNTVGRQEHSIIVPLSCPFNQWKEYYSSVSSENNRVIYTTDAVALWVAQNTTEKFSICLYAGSNTLDLGTSVYEDGVIESYPSESIGISCLNNDVDITDALLNHISRLIEISDGVSVQLVCSGYGFDLYQDLMNCIITFAKNRSLHFKLVAPEDIILAVHKYCTDHMRSSVFNHQSLLLQYTFKEVLLLTKHSSLTVINKHTLLPNKTFLSFSINQDSDDFAESKYDEYDIVIQIDSESFFSYRAHKHNTYVLEIEVTNNCISALLNNKEMVLSNYNSSWNLPEEIKLV